MKKFIGLIFIASWLLLILAPAVQGGTAYLQPPDPSTGPDISPVVKAALQEAGADEMVRVIVRMKKQADLAGLEGLSRDERVRRVVSALRETAVLDQVPIQAFLHEKQNERAVARIMPFWVFNGLSLAAKPVVINALANRQDVAAIYSDETFQAPLPLEDTTTIQPNLTLIQAPALWDLGFLGQDIVVASMDTGVYLYHPSLEPRWRGGTNSWFDPYGEHPALPTDTNGHGTQTMGVMVGTDAGGSAIGAAPAAQWIAVKIFNDQDQATSTAIHAGYQWLLDPDGNPATADAPHVVNNSWGSSGPGCSLEFQLDLQALRAANILPIFSAGNAGPSPETSTSPANNPEAFAVGAVDLDSQIYIASSRGPSACGEPVTIFPEMVAPGVGIYTADFFGAYSLATGTSIAAPHAAGGLALLLSAHPNLTANEQAAALLAGAVDLGAAGPDNEYGYGRLDLLASFNTLQSAEPTPTPDLSTNLALNQPVTVSSQLDESHSGAQAVDGNWSTYWQTKKPAKKNPLPAEWMTIDLGSIAGIDQITLSWGGSYATHYNIEVSADNDAWTSLYTTTDGAGGLDVIPLAGQNGRFVRLYTTGWSDSVLRIQLLELEVYGNASEPPAQPTATPTPAASPTPTAAAQVFHHVGNLTGISSPDKRDRWNAAVTILIHDADEQPLAGVDVSGSWTEVSGGGSCTTDASGLCTIVKSGIKDSVSMVGFTVLEAISGFSLYDPAANHDPDLDSDGTQIWIGKP